MDLYSKMGHCMKILYTSNEMSLFLVQIAYMYIYLRVNLQIDYLYCSCTD